MPMLAWQITEENVNCEFSRSPLLVSSMFVVGIDIDNECRVSYRACGNVGLPVAHTGNEGCLKSLIFPLNFPKAAWTNYEKRLASLFGDVRDAECVHLSGLTAIRSRKRFHRGGGGIFF